MLLHDSFFFIIQRRINETFFSPITIAHSPLFHSTLTLLINIFGACSNIICILYLSSIISQYKQRKSSVNKIEQQKQSVHVLSHKKYRFLLILTSNDFFLCLSAIISCLDEKYYFQALVARFHLCSLHNLLWKFTLHFIPLLTIFILLRYHYILNKRFPTKTFTTTTLDQLLLTDLCILIPFVIALAWSVDGLWLWGEANIQNFVIPTAINNEINQTKESFSTSPMNKIFHQSYGKLEGYYNNNDYLPEQQIICYLQTNNNLSFTARLIYLIEADYLLLFSLHFMGLILEICLHIRLSCCLTARKISPSFLREQQLSLYILYIFTCLTLTSLPFYLYRTIEIIFDSITLSYLNSMINSRTLAQVILSGISCKPVLYFIIFSPSKFLFKFKCYTTIKIENINQLQNILLIKNQQDKYGQRAPHERYSLRFTTLYPKVHAKFRSLSHPAITIDNRHSVLIGQNEIISKDDFP
ncbi:unnamed protein product [Rotaria socialis]|uniref:Uncharacterized protein n=1 Tax=Rotaria socialis TaxID=392032 RepID=A0A818Y299_9BILA|nr:unnamed protein product [Rotaria socialis]CAF3600040.1 unnamed protein product [Rotaria socialis]CAF3748518.1 unnamed protein product [Rotaria socialis]CAF4322384.1 unnamed protein product [Rotaria socialis]CAF4419104.1 unnamed protein product [Rotaria socialis]